MLSIIDLRKKIGIGKNRYRQVTLPKNWKSESAKIIAIGASLEKACVSVYSICAFVLKVKEN